MNAFFYSSLYEDVHLLVIADLIQSIQKEKINTYSTIL